MIVHRQPREQRGSTQAGGELPFPRARIVRAGGGTVADQALRQQPGRLDRHADAFGDDGMGLARDIAHKEYAVAITGPDTGSDRAGGEDRVLDRCALQRAPRAFGARQDMRESPPHPPCHHEFRGLAPAHRGGCSRTG